MELAAEEGVPLQSFVVRSDMACGSTIGPLTAANIGVRTLDIGVPTFAMHSIRELAGGVLVLLGCVVISKPCIGGLRAAGVAQAW